MSLIIHKLRTIARRKESRRLKENCRKLAEESRKRGDELFGRMLRNEEGSDADGGHNLEHVYQHVDINDILRKLESSDATGSPVVVRSGKRKSMSSAEKSTKTEGFLESLDGGKMDVGTVVRFSQELSLGYVSIPMQRLQEVISSRGHILDELTDGYIKVLSSNDVEDGKHIWECRLHAFGEDADFSLIHRRAPLESENPTTTSECVMHSSFQAESSHPALSQWIIKLNEELQNQFTYNDPLAAIRCGVDLYEQNYRHWRIDVIEDTRNAVKMTTKCSDDEIDGKPFMQTKATILQQVRHLLSQSSPYFELRPINIFWWQLRLSKFDAIVAEMQSVRMEEELKSHAATFHTNDASILVEIKFPAQYPIHPPGIRIIRPRIRYLTGGVTFAGTFETPLFSSAGWEPKAHILALSQYLRAFLIKNGARIDMDTAKLYETQVAHRAVSRSFNSVHLKKEITTQNSFERDFHLYNMNFAAEFLGVQMQHLERGNRILLPQCVADEIFANPFFTMPLLFEIDAGPRHVYVSVAEFTAPNDIAILPDYLMKALLLPQGSKARIRCVNLPKAISAKFQPHNKQFYKIKNHKQVLEHALRSFATLTEGTSIPIEYMGKKHFIEVVEVHPSPAAHIVADPYLELRVEFEAAADLEDGESLMEPDDDSDCADLTPLPACREDVFADSPAHDICSTCHKSIPKARMVIHSIHCEKNYIKCIKCELPVLRSEVETHEEKYHALAKCSACDAEMEKHHMGKHKKEECRMRVEYCQFCMLPVESSAKASHEAVCGSQTEMCIGCDQYVSLRDRETHRQDCQGRHLLLPPSSWVPGEFTCPHCSFPSLLFGELLEHLKSVHEDELDTPVACPVCQEGTTDNTETQEVLNLYDHLLSTHT